MEQQTQSTQLQHDLKLRQIEILNLLLTFSFLTTNHIQTLLNHQYKEKINEWLTDLLKKQYIFRFYEPHVPSKPAVYCLNKGSIPYLGEKGVEGNVLKRIYKEKTLSSQFQRHCQLLAHIYISLLSLVKTTNATLKFYSKAELDKINNLISPAPDAYFVITEANNKKKRYFLDIFDPYKPWKTYKWRVQNYIKYYKSHEWQEHTKKRIS